MVRRLGKELHQTSNKIRRQIERISLTHGITGFQGIVLDYLLSREGTVLQRDIEQEFDIRRSTVSGVLALLEKNGFISRGSVAGDARQRQVTVTEKGRKVHAVVGMEIDRYEQQVLDSLRLSEQERFFALLDRLSAAAETESRGGSDGGRRKKRSDYARRSNE